MKQYFTGYGSGSVPRQGATRQSGSGGGARVVERNAPKAEWPYPRNHHAGGNLAKRITLPLSLRLCRSE
jgi:hypothetical protein